MDIYNPEEEPMQVKLLDETALLSSLKNPNVTIRRPVGIDVENHDVIALFNDEAATLAAHVMSASGLRRLINGARSGQYPGVCVDGDDYVWINPEHVLREVAGGPFPIAR